MPLPLQPTQKPRLGATTQAQLKADKDLLIKGILCLLIGLGVLLSPYFIASPNLQSIVAKSNLVGWFALVLGIAFIGLYARRRWAGAARQG